MSDGLTRSIGMNGLRYIYPIHFHNLTIFNANGRVIRRKVVICHRADEKISGIENHLAQLQIRVVGAFEINGNPNRSFSDLIPVLGIVEAYLIEYASVVRSNPSFSRPPLMQIMPDSLFSMEITSTSPECRTMVSPTFNAAISTMSYLS